MAKSADLSQFQVKKPSAAPEAESPPPKRAKPKAARGGDMPKLKAASGGEARKLKGFRIKREAAKQLAILKIETDTDEQDLVAEALNLLFKKYGKPQIA